MGKEQRARLVLELTVGIAEDSLAWNTSDLDSSIFLLWKRDTYGHGVSLACKYTRLSEFRTFHHSYDHLYHLMGST